MPIYEIVRSGGIAPGGFNFDAKLRRQSIDRNDLFYAHIGGLDTLAMALLVAASIVEDNSLEELRAERYAGWSGDLGSGILGGDVSLEDLEQRVASGAVTPERHSGHQEMLENLVNRHIWSTLSTERN
jgi:xylose isomerase